MKRFKFSGIFLSLILLGVFVAKPSFAQEEFESELSDSKVNSEITPAEISSSESLSTPQAPSGFVRPPGPKKGGTLVLPHPGAAQGLIRINKDGSYQYKTQQIAKSQAGSFRIANVSPPKIFGPSNLSYSDIYGSSNMIGLLADYEWQPFRGFGALGLQLGTGIMTSRGNGRFADLGVADEVYDLYVIPASVFAVYRFEYMRRQWFVPYVVGGGTIYGIIEKRDDAKPAKVATAPAAGFGGGLHISISRWDQQGAFVMQKEYGVADLWLTMELRIIQGLRSDIDFTNRTASLGITVDY